MSKFRSRLQKKQQELQNAKSSPKEDDKKSLLRAKKTRSKTSSSPIIRKRSSENKTTETRTPLIRKRKTETAVEESETVEPIVSSTPVKTKVLVSTSDAPEKTEQVIESPVESIETQERPDTEEQSPSSEVRLEEFQDAQQSATESSATEGIQTSEESTTEAKPDPLLAGLGKAVIAPPPNYRPGGRNSTSSSTKEEDADSKSDKPWKKEKEKTKSKVKSRRLKQRNWGDEEQEVKEDTRPNRRRKKNRKNKLQPKASPKAKAIKRRVMVNGTITVANLAHEMSQKTSVVIKKLIGMGQMSSINDELDIDTATIIAEEFEFEVVDTSFQEEEFLITEEETDTGNTEVRPPIVTIMGHVDHGKTTLLDTIRKANVAAGEAGGITQHTSAYQVTHNDQLITFIDTPGHEAFTSMRARGAQVTDIVILVVAADDGPMPQTIEALNHARASGVQLMVAINKCDKPGANPDKVRQDMMRYELVDEAYGGDTIFVEVSALQGHGIEDLLENVLLLSEMGEFNADYGRHADGFVLEARLEKGKGAVATLLVKNGTLKQGDTLVLGSVWGRVRAMNDHKGKRMKKALPSMPVELIGLKDIPVAGDDFVVVKNDKDAKALVDHRQEQAKAKQAASKKVSLEDLIKMQQAGELVKLNLIVKSDVGGTLEALRASIAKIDVPGTEVNIMHEAIGAITEGDVSLAHTYEGIIIGFNVRPDAKARTMLNQTGVELRTYDVIYNALEDIEKGLKGLLSPEIKEEWKGLAEIRQTFNVPKVGTVAGCFVLDGQIARKHQVRLLREGTIIWEGKLASLKRFKDDVREVEKGYECGMNLDGFNDIKIGDQLETFTMEEVSK